MSHSRGIIEWYRLKEDSFQWMYGDSSLQWREPALLQEKIRWLPRRAPYAALRPIPVRYMGGVCDMEDSGEAEAGFVLTIAREFNRKWYESFRKKISSAETPRAEGSPLYRYIPALYAGEQR